MPASARERPGRPARRAGVDEGAPVPRPADGTLTVGRHRVDVTNLGKLWYPESGTTKGEVLGYYAEVSPWMVPHLDGHPLNLKRYPNGVDQPFFFQKEAPANRPAWLRTATVWSETKGDDIHYCTVRDAASLLWIANTGNLEFLALLGRGADVDHPTAMVFDLDPGPGTGLKECCEVALLVRAELRHAKLEGFPKTSGGKGMQVYVPLNSRSTFAATTPFSRALAERLAASHPDAVVSNMRKSLRNGKVLIDWSQNSRHKSTVCAYSLRARATPSVSTPLSWDEVEEGARSSAARAQEALRFTPAAVLGRLEERGDLFAPVLAKVQRLRKAS